MSTSNWFRSSSYVVDLKTNQYLRFIKMPNRQYCVIFRVFQHIMGVPHQRTMPSVFRSHVSARPPKTTKSSPKFPHRQHWNKQSATTNTSNRFSHFFCSETHFCLFAWLLQKSYLRFLKEIIQSGHCNCVWKHVKKWVSTENVVCSQVLIFCMIASHINFLQKPWQNTSMLETTDVWPPRRGLKHSHCDLPLADVMQQLKNCVIVPNLGKHRDHMDVWHD